jgi:hypothetical protein
MIRMHDREMAVENRKWIAVEGELGIERDALFLGIEIRGA